MITTARPLPAALLADIASGIAVTPVWHSIVRHDPISRQAVRLVATEWYEVWVIGWTLGQNVRVHDHGPSAGAFQVVEGELTEVIPSGRGATVEVTVHCGQLRHLPPGAIHDVANRSDVPATSVHVYSPPLVSMTYYDPDTLEAVVTESVEPAPPALAAAVTSSLIDAATCG